MSSSGQDTDTDMLHNLAMRVEILEGVNRALEDEYRRIRRDAMYLENVVANMWRATMGPIPDTPDTPATPDPTPPTPVPRPRPPVPRPPVTPTPEPMPTPPPPPKPPSGPVNKASDAINSIKNAFGW
jgi:hypothetical protein